MAYEEDCEEEQSPLDKVPALLSKEYVLPRTFVAKFFKQLELINAKSNQSERQCDCEHSSEKSV